MLNPTTTKGKPVIGPLLIVPAYQVQRVEYKPPKILTKDLSSTLANGFARMSMLTLASDYVGERIHMSGEPLSNEEKAAYLEAVRRSLQIDAPINVARQLRNLASHLDARGNGSAPLLGTTPHVEEPTAIEAIPYASPAKIRAGKIAKLLGPQRSRTYVSEFDAS